MTHSSTRYLKCLDPILTNYIRVRSPSSTVGHFSDHALVDAMLTAPPKCNMQGEPNMTFKRNWSADSINQFERALQRNRSLSAPGIESIWEEWRSKFTSALNEAVPLSVSVLTRARSKKRKCPWMTAQLLHLLQKQKAMYRRVIRSGRRDTVAVQQQRALRNQYNNLYRQNKNIYFQEHLAEYRYAPRPLWKAINHITGRQQQRFPSSVPLSKLKSYFESLYSTPVSRQLTIPEGPPNNFCLTQFQPVTERRVKDLRMKLNEYIEKKAAGHDGICSKELKVVADKIAWQLAILFNESLETGEIPSDFKTGNSIPIFKSGKKDITAPENYRGISLTPLVSKVLERIVFDEVSAFLSNRKLLSKLQSGFRASHSCSDLLLATPDDWLQVRDKKQYAIAVFIDLSKAFDKVLHEHLPLTLQACGISGTALRWFRNFLYDRTIGNRG